MIIETRLAELGLTLPDAASPAFNYVPVVVWGDVAYVSGQLPKVGGEVQVTGKVPDEVSVEAAREAARVCILQAVACLKQELGDLDRVGRILKVTGFVNSGPGFSQQPHVINAASDLLTEIFGDAGRHARSAVGVAELPRRSPVEIELVVGLNR